MNRQSRDDIERYLEALPETHLPEGWEERLRHRMSAGAQPPASQRPWMPATWIGYAAVAVTALLVGYLFGSLRTDGTPRTEGLVFASQYELGERLFNLGLDFARERLSVQEIPRHPRGASPRTLVLIDLKEVFRSILDVPGLQGCRLTPEFYNGARFPQHLQMADLDGDGNPEILFSAHSEEDPRISGHLLCFSLEGRLQWHYRLGGDYRMGDTGFARHYGRGRIILADLDGDLDLEIIVRSLHRVWAPTQIVILEAHGGTVEALGELWSFGYLEELEPADLDFDGFKEIVCIGTNNRYNSGLVAVLDPLLFEGLPPDQRVGVVPIVLDGETLAQTVNGARRDVAGVRYLIRVPNPYGTRDAQALTGGRAYRGTLYELRVDAQSESLHCAYGGHYPEGEGFIHDMVAFLRFDFDLRLKDVSFHDTYTKRRSAPNRRGFMARSLEEERGELMQVRYWDGAAWVDEPTRVLP